jgi:DNA-binding transcriptional ArsR family regulator
MYWATSAASLRSARARKSRSSAKGSPRWSGDQVRWTSNDNKEFDDLRTTMTTATPLAPDIPHPALDDLDLASVLHALSDPVRLEIVAGLAAGDERNCGSFDVAVTKSTCTHHFRVLREAGLIRQRQQGTMRLNSLRRDDLEARFPGLLGTILGAAAAPR